MNSFLVAALVRQSCIGALLVALSLPLLLLVHRSFGLGNPPLAGLLVLGVAVVLSFAGAGIIGALVGAARGNALLAALLGLGLGGVVSATAAPFYASMVVDSLTHEALGLVWNERDRITGGLSSAAQNALTQGVGKTFDAARQGRLREQLGAFQQQAETATTPQARQVALQRAKSTALELAALGRERGVTFVKSGVARLSAFALLFWTVAGAPWGALFEARRRRR